MLKSALSYFILIIAILLTNSATSQTVSSHKEVLKFLKSKNNCQALTCLNEIDTTLKQKLDNKNKKIQQIILIRHAKPQVEKKTFYSSKKANKYINNYNIAPIYPFDSTSVKNKLRHKYTVFCSNLRRSKETAFTIFKDNHEIISDSLFREFENKILKAPSFIQLPLPLWQVLSRGTWALGVKRNGIESHKEAKTRAQNAALKLIENSHKQETTILVAHGMLNGVIKKNLKRYGWTVIQNKGKKNLGATILIKIDQ